MTYPFHLPTPTPDTDVQEFFGTDASFSWQVWTKPRGKTVCSILCIGSGGGGGGGFSRISGDDGGGGGGGGSGALGRIIIPLIFLPENLYVQVPRGGNGGVAASVGTGGGLSRISLVPATIAGSNLLRSGAAVGGFGGAGSGTGGGAGGAAGTADSASNCVYHGLGIWTPLAGQVGAAGGAHTGAVGSSITWGQAGLPISGGAGGGGSSGLAHAGGDITVSNNPFVKTLNSTSIAGTPGPDGFMDWQHFLFSGGAGGATNDAAIGGKGGDGALGCGGGGGGGGVTGGAGGRGGDGYVLIMSW
jgi:hypothetical protein